MGSVVVAELQAEHVPLLLVIGLAVFAGTIGGRLFQRLRIPQVVGYIAVGLLLGQSGFELIGADLLESLEPFSFFALGLIGFMIGGELHGAVFARHGRQLLAILVGEGLGAFVLVSVVVGAIALLVTGEVAKSIGLGLLFGAISSATAPAATVNVLWEYKARGPLTTAIFAIVALDDALALALYAVASNVAWLLAGGGGSDLAGILGAAGRELLGAVVLGGVAGCGLNFLLRSVRDYEKSVPLVIGSLALVIGACMALGLDLILAPMALGVALVNLAPRRSQAAFRIVEQFASPLYVLFFVVVGAHLEIHGMPAWLWAMAAAYVVARSAGKILGANLGGRLARAAPVLRKYLGASLFCQGGVAVGLSILAGARFSGIMVAEVDVGAAVIMIIAATTVFVELVGPSCVKFAIKRAGEVGRNITEADLVHSYKVVDVMARNSPRFSEDTVLREILRTIAETSTMCYPVVGAQGHLSGMITMQELKQSFGGEGLSDSCPLR